MRRIAVDMLQTPGRIILESGTANEALRIAHEEDLDVVVAEVAMPEICGLTLLQKLRENHLDLPVVFVTGSPTLETARTAVAHGAFRYLLKPVTRDEPRAAVDQAERVRALSWARDPRGVRQALENNLRGALLGMWMALQPIVDARTGEPIGFEALLRSHAPKLQHPKAMLDAAEKLGIVHTVGRRARAAIAEIIEAGANSCMYFVNLHPSDLADDDLIDPNAPLSRFAPQVVLELTERTALESVADLSRRLTALRVLGYRLAIDDLGAGYAGLSYFAIVRPEIVKVDISLVRGIDRDEVKQRVVSAIVSLANSVGIRVVAEGVETEEERITLVQLGCDLLQGYLFARPQPSI
jgi:EAL domain-containing protein (putative c-di-GMP-specific phosphodiesterase class I)